jgi:hypothetical protein
MCRPSTGESSSAAAAPVDRHRLTRRAPTQVARVQRPIVQDHAVVTLSMLYTTISGERRRIRREAHCAPFSLTTSIVTMPPQVGLAQAWAFD